MASLKDLLEEWPRIIVLYPVFLTILEQLETKFPLVKEVRLNPERYPAPYISKRGLCGIVGFNDEQMVELFTNFNNLPVEVIAKIYRRKPQSWLIEKCNFEGYLLACPSNCNFVSDDTIRLLREDFL